MNKDVLPNSFCWTRFGTEAGEAIGHILQRKENERAANDGIFIWGIGNAIGPSIRELLRRDAKPEVLFSPMKSAPKRQDVLPPAVAAWTSGETLDGDVYCLPEHSLVTSRFDPALPKETHYALVCFSRGPITPTHPVGKIAFAALRNLLTGRPIGASQVTAVVQALEGDLGRSQTYDVAIRAELVYPYFVKLRQPLALPRSANGEGAKRDWTESAFELIRRRRESPSPLQAALTFR
jgi:hypothetical protein